MKTFDTIATDLNQCQKELAGLRALLNIKQDLSERNDLQPLFKTSPQLTALIGSLIPGLGPAKLIAYEFPIFGDYAADIVIGNLERKTFCVIELEDAGPNSVFDKTGNRSTSAWGRRLEHGFSQLVDWFFALDDYKNSAGFANYFSHGHISFHGLLLIGRTADISEHDRTRLRWRADKVIVNSHNIRCLTYDDLCTGLENEWRFGATLPTPPL